MAGGRLLMFVVLIFMGIRGILWDFRVEEEAEREIFIDGSFKHFSSDFFADFFMVDRSRRCKSYHWVEAEGKLKGFLNKAWEFLNKHMGEWGGVKSSLKLMLCPGMFLIFQVLVNSKEFQFIRLNYLLWKSRSILSGKCSVFSCCCRM